MTFVELQSRLLAVVRERVHNGEQTERGFARLTGISQPHIHKALKGTQLLSTEYFDLILIALKKSVLDLSSEAELRECLKRRESAGAPEAELPFLASPIGPGCVWTPEVRWGERHLAPCSLLEESESPVLARLAADPKMRFSGQGFDIVALDLAPDGPLAHAIYAVDRGDDVVLRRVRRGRDSLYLAPDENAGEPLHWERFSPSFPGGESRIRGRVIWFGRERVPQPRMARSGGVARSETRRRRGRALAPAAGISQPKPRFPGTPQGLERRTFPS